MKFIKTMLLASMLTSTAWAQEAKYQSFVERKVQNLLYKTACKLYPLSKQGFDRALNGFGADLGSIVAAGTLAAGSFISGLASEKRGLPSKKEAGVLYFLTDNGYLAIDLSPPKSSEEIKITEEINDNDGTTLVLASWNGTKGYRFDITSRFKSRDVANSSKSQVKGFLELEHRNLVDPAAWNFIKIHYMLKIYPPAGASKERNDFLAKDYERRLELSKKPDFAYQDKFKEEERKIFSEKNYEYILKFGAFEA